jgi:hypothetical protein
MSFEHFLKGVRVQGPETMRTKVPLKVPLIDYAARYRRRTVLDEAGRVDEREGSSEDLKTGNEK